VAGINLVQDALLALLHCADEGLYVPHQPKGGVAALQKTVQLNRASAVNWAAHHAAARTLTNLRHNPCDEVNLTSPFA